VCIKNPEPQNIAKRRSNDYMDREPRRYRALDSDSGNRGHQVQWRPVSSCCTYQSYNENSIIRNALIYAKQSLKGQ
jgi:hypothetical protein